MKRFLVIVGGDVILTPYMRRQVRGSSWDHIIACDKGVENALRLGFEVNEVHEIMGDFDSADAKKVESFMDAGIPYTKFPARKDFTDSELGIFAAMDRAEQGDEILLVGGIGSRLDHTLANIWLLMRPLERGLRARILSGTNEIELLQGPAERNYDREEDLKYLSLIPMSETVTGVDLTGFEYPLQQRTMERGASLGVSNEILKDLEGKAQLSFTGGLLAVIRSGDTP